jgi:small subunit ribosomal protein S16
VAVKIRLKRLGKIRSPHYRIVVMDSRNKRDGRAIEEIGLYHPKNDPSVIRVNSERAQYWLGVGAQPTEAVVALFKRSGDWQTFTGDKTPSGIDAQPLPKDKVAAYNRALAEGDGASASDAISKPSRKAKAAPEPEAPAEEPVLPAVSAASSDDAAEQA